MEVDVATALSSMLMLGEVFVRFYTLVSNFLNLFRLLQETFVKPSVLKKILFFFAGLFAILSSHGQSTDLEVQTKSLFSENIRLKWVKQFKGRINDYNDVVIVMGYDGMLCKGILQYIRSGDQFQLDGLLEKDQLILKETDSNGNISGYIKGSLVDNTFEGNWSNFNNTIGSPISFEEESNPDLIPSYCGNDKWMRRYTAIFGKEAIELSIQKLQGERVSGMIYFRTENKTYKTAGTWSIENGLALQLKDDYGVNIGKLIAPKVSTENFKGSIIYSPTDFINCKFRLNAKLNTGCIENSDYLSMYDLIFPKTSNAAFNNWIEDLITGEARNFSKMSNQATATLVALTPENRHYIRSNGWFEIGFFNDNLLSGILLLESTIDEKRAIPINFDLTNNRPILFEDIFRKEYDHDYFVEKIIRTAFTKHTLYKKDESFRIWIKSVSFPHMILLRNGIHFSSDFNSIYGRQGITIPYDKLEGFVEKGSWVDFSFRQ